MQALSVGRAEPVEHRKTSYLDAYGINNQLVPFIMSNRIAIPGRRHLCRMRLVHTHLAKLMIEGVKEGDFFWLLKHLHSKIRENEGHSFWPTLVAWSRIALTSQRNLPELLD